MTAAFEAIASLLARLANALVGVRLPELPGRRPVFLALPAAIDRTTDHDEAGTEVVSLSA